MYNDSNLTSANNLFDIWKALEQLSGGILGVMFTLTISIVIFVALNKKESDTTQTLIISSFFTSIISILLWTAGLVSIYALIFPIILLFGSLIVYAFSS